VDANVSIRPATAADVDTIVAFNAAMALETEHKRLDPAVLTRGVRQAIADAQRCAYFVAEIDGRVWNGAPVPDRIVGQTMVTYEWSDWRDGWFWWIQSVYVHPEFRRRGVFRALYRHVRELARARPDVCGLRLYVEQHNARAHATYRRLGMVPSGHVVYEDDWSRSSEPPACPPVAGP
jgi:ribosomal protein S18 acetylase RimI-like enzyme